MVNINRCVAAASLLLAPVAVSAFVVAIFDMRIGSVVAAVVGALSWNWLLLLINGHLRVSSLFILLQPADPMLKILQRLAEVANAIDSNPNIFFELHCMAFLAFLIQLGFLLNLDFKQLDFLVAPDCI